MTTICIAEQKNIYYDNYFIWETSKFYLTIELNQKQLNETMLFLDWTNSVLRGFFFVPIPSHIEHNIFVFGKKIFRLESQKTLSELLLLFVHGHDDDCKNKIIIKNF